MIAGRRLHFLWIHPQGQQSQIFLFLLWPGNRIGLDKGLQAPPGPALHVRFVRVRRELRTIYLFTAASLLTGRAEFVVWNAIVRFTFALDTAKEASMDFGITSFATERERGIAPRRGAGWRKPLARTTLCALTVLGVAFTADAQPKEDRET